MFIEYNLYKYNMVKLIITTLFKYLTDCNYYKIKFYVLYIYYIRKNIIRIPYL